MALEIGRVCMKTAGREAGRYCVVLKKIDDDFVFVTGPKVLTGVKRRRCNIEHLEPTQYKVTIKAEASEKDVIKAYEEVNLVKKFGLRKPSPEVVKEAEKKVKKEKPKKKEKEEKKEDKGIKIKLKMPSLKKKEEPKKEEKKEKPKKKEKKKPKKKVKKEKPKKAEKKAKKKTTKKAKKKKSTKKKAKKTSSKKKTKKKKK
jgi:large subunit ribosomal protein L14e